MGLRLCCVLVARSTGLILVRLLLYWLVMVSGCSVVMVCSMSLVLTRFDERVLRVVAVIGVGSRCRLVLVRVRVLRCVCSSVGGFIVWLIGCCSRRVVGCIGYCGTWLW